jgi:uncharacterized DUF497 family protein
MITGFRWNQWNVEHATKHGVSIAEIESVVCGASRPYPKKLGDGKWIVVGRGNGGRFIEVIFVLDADKSHYVIHAMPVTPRRPKRGRKQ